MTMLPVVKFPLTFAPVVLAACSPMTRLLKGGVLRVA